VKISEAVSPPAENRSLLPLWTPPYGGGVFRRAELVNLYRSAEGMLETAAPRIFQLVSATSGEGTSTIARELAAAVAETIGRRVLLLRIAPRGASIGRSLDAVLRGDIPLRAAITNPAGGAHFTAGLWVADQPNPRLLDAQVIRGLFERLLSLVEVIIIDSPAALTEFAGLALVGQVAGIILVVEAERTQVATVDRAKRLIEVNGGRILGLVLNKSRRRLPG
jgi:polysaccharide biosynthesis transport protein